MADFSNGTTQAKTELEEPDRNESDLFIETKVHNSPLAFYIFSATDTAIATSVVALYQLNYVPNHFQLFYLQPNYLSNRFRRNSSILYHIIPNVFSSLETSLRFKL